MVTSPGPGRDQRPAYWSVMPASSENGRPRCTARRLANCRSGCWKRMRRRTDMIARSAAYFSPGVAAWAYHSLSIANSSARGFSLSAGTLFATYSSVRSASAIFSSAVRAGGYTVSFSACTAHTAANVNKKRCFLMWRIILLTDGHINQPPSINHRSFLACRTRTSPCGRHASLRARSSSSDEACPASGG